MDYEKKYKEALEKAKRFCALPTDKATMEEIFPELRESEDERTRKYLIDFVGLSDNPRKGEMIAYLEKQKEQKHYWKPTETDVALFSKAITTNKTLTPTERAQLDIVRSKFGCCRAVNCSGIVQKEQKSAEPTGKLSREEYLYQLLIDQLITYSDYEYLTGKNPAWSEEDEDMLNSCISSIEEAKENRYAYKETDGDTSYDHEIAWLKSLRPQPHTVSIKDSTKFGNLEYERGVKDGIQYAENHHWKPSKEQMEELMGGLRILPAGETYHILLSLYNDLKKL